MVAILVTIALIAGVGLMIYAVGTSNGWTIPAAGPPRVAASEAARGETDYVPAQPQPAYAAPPTVDVGALATRETTLAAQLATLEARTASVSADAAAAAGQAARAEAILIAFAARRAIDRGTGLGYLEEQLRARFGTAQPRATLAIIQAARQPVTLEDLRQGLEANARDLVSGGTGNLLASLTRELRTLVVVHRADTPSPRPIDRLARARRLLDAGQVDAAVAEVKQLPGAALAGRWMQAAQRYAQARRALDVIENVAVLNGGASTTPPAAAPAVATPPAL